MNITEPLKDWLMMWFNQFWGTITEELITQARSFCNAPGGPYLYDEALQSDLILIRAAEEKAAAGDFDGAGELLGKPAFAALSRKKPKDPVAVSYTHLDVYKRQALQCGSSIEPRKYSWICT